MATIKLGVEKVRNIRKLLALHIYRLVKGMVSVGDTSQKYITR